MIYFVQADGTDLVKIGFTRSDPLKRVGELQTGCPHRLTLLATIQGSEQDEASWHRDFASDRATGEWFKMSWRMCLAIARAEADQSTRARLLAADPDRRQLHRLIGRSHPSLAAHLAKVSSVRFHFAPPDTRCFLAEIGFPDSEYETALLCTTTDSIVYFRAAWREAFGPGTQPLIEIHTESECLLQTDPCPDL